MVTSVLHQRLAARVGDVSRAIGASTQYRDRFRDHEWRERFQLLVAALIYSWRGLCEFPTERLHSTTMERTASPDAWTNGDLLSLPEIPDLSVDQLKELLAGVHIASASVRVSTADYLLNGPGRNLEALKAAGVAPCCKDRPAGTAGAAQDRAIVDAHRDSFGHGEEGEGAGKGWWTGRSEHFTRLHICRVIDSQLRLIVSGLGRLADGMTR